MSGEFLEWEERDVSKVSLAKHCFAGSCAGVIEHLAMYPIDTLKTHLQASGGRLSFSKTAKILYQDEGMVKGFFKGADVMAYGCVPAHAAQFLVYEVLKEKLCFKNEEINFFKTMMIGASTTFAHDLFIAPSDVIKQRLQLHSNQSTS